MDHHAELAQLVMPAGSNGEFNLPSELSIVIERGHGCELWDTTGRRFLDFSTGWGSVLVGHARPEVVAAVTRQAALGSNFSYPTAPTVALAAELVRLSPACEQVRFCASGTEATMYCQRLARAFTGRPKILKFEGAYHGANEVGVTSLFPQAPPDFPQPDPTSAGIEEIARVGILVAPYNDLAVTRRLIEAHVHELAAVIVEPLQRCTPPRPGFLEGLRELTRQHDVLLIFDEVVTGFRLAYGGAQEYYGVVPDLVAYGKALGGGYPIGAFGGRRELLALVCEERLGQLPYVWTASTLGGNPISAAAALAALGVFRGAGVYARLHALGRYLRSGLVGALQAYGVVGQILGDGPLAQVVFSPQPVHDYRSGLRADRARARALMLELFRSGIFLNPMGTKLYLSLAHDEAACDELIELFTAALRRTG
ncbi:MAG: aminotransferase class III-fold pyridoxal phosphate-dependent enzyme [Pirellulales bacterium]|nr:aminotransferase class III-fold pyridoxal phosphate-dependent enzyme [Pirellulales bacterium]